jgi:hypothetical protein
MPSHLQAHILLNGFLDLIFALHIRLASNHNACKQKPSLKMPVDTDFFTIADESTTTIFLATDNIEPQRKSKTDTDLGAY